MEGYFVNPEIKKSSIVLLCINFIFLLGTLTVTKINTDNLKKGYIRTLGVVTTKIDEKNPELLKEIVPEVTKKVSDKEARDGIKILREYGLTDDLQDDLFPYVNETILRNTYYIIAIFLVMAVVFFILNYLQCTYFYKGIRQITLAAKKVIEGEYDISIPEDSEGDFSKLAISFNSMRGIIRSNIEDLKKEKQFLVDLLSDISHQLKTPISSMILYNDILTTKELSKDKRNTFLENNKKQLYRMNWLIKSILKLARLDAKAIEFSKENTSLNETIENSIDAIVEKAEEAKIKIKFNGEEQINFLHDKEWFEEALINIIKNGIEHTKLGGSINIMLVETPVYVRIEIADTGDGISKKDLPNIFKRFYKAQNSKSDSVGIGLALSKSIVEAHNGVIEAKSEIGKGTMFTITLLKY
ncbi:HAMP domain-containing sensor histidine kinase [Clostridium hydrogenum]|uniref:HAMP domain-containing sensor histidine kinase n=1 Tax=Clostridium hydrogenum TaxID=2855764 RepID=UPI001F47AF55|nr:HAMP domain-containing sensor histidine kinase [Clostridium hydrogenum]